MQKGTMQCNLLSLHIPNDDSFIITPYTEATSSEINFDVVYNDREYVCARFLKTYILQEVVSFHSIMHCAPQKNSSQGDHIISYCQGSSCCYVINIGGNSDVMMA